MYYQHSHQKLCLCTIHNLQRIDNRSSEISICCNMVFFFLFLFWSSFLIWTFLFLCNFLILNYLLLFSSNFLIGGSGPVGNSLARFVHSGLDSHMVPITELFWLWLSWFATSTSVRQEKVLTTEIKIWNTIIFLLIASLHGWQDCTRFGWVSGKNLRCCC